MTAEKVVGAQYVVTGNTWDSPRVGTVVTLEHDDGSNMPRFTLPDGDTQWIPMQDVVKLIVDGDEPVATADTLDFEDLEKDVVYKDSDGDYVLLVSKPVNGVDLFIADAAITRIVDYYEADELDDGGYSKATGADTEQVMQLFKQYVLENQKHISEAEVAELQEGDKITIVDYLYKGEDFGVYCSRAMTEDVGKAFTAQALSSSGNVLTDETIWSYSYDMIASVEKAVNQEKPKFAIGDKVLVTAADHHHLEVGTVGTVISVYSEPDKFVVTGKSRTHGKTVKQIVDASCIELAVKQYIPKYAVGDIVVYSDGIFSSDDWEVARRITAVDLDKQKYVMEWADGTPGWAASGATFEEVDHQFGWKQFTGEIPAAKAVEQPHITAEQFAAIKVGDKLKLRTDLGTQDVYGDYWANGPMVELAVKGITPKVTRIDGDGTVKAEAEDDYWYYTAAMIAEVIPAEPEFNCPELVAGQVYFIEKGFKWVFRYLPVGTNKHGDKWVGGSHTAVDATCNNLYTSPHGLSIDTDYRKATAEETAKLEAAEKEHGYVPPLVNKVGTVIEAGKYYKIKGWEGTEYICKVVDVFKDSFQKAGLLVELDGTPTDTKTPPITPIGSLYGRTAVPATGEQIALYEAVITLRTAQKTFEDATQAVKEAA